MNFGEFLADKSFSRRAIINVNMKTENSTQKTLTLLHSGKHPNASKYAGKHVLVIEDKIVPLKKGSAALKDFDRLKKLYGKPPILVFVPRRDVSYILFVCN